MEYADDKTIKVNKKEASAANDEDENNEENKGTEDSGEEEEEEDEESKERRRLNDTSDLFGVTFYPRGKDGKKSKASTIYSGVTGKGLCAYFSTKAEACSAVDSINRYCSAVSNYSLRGDVFLFSRAGRNLGKSSVQHAPGTCNQLPDDKPLVYRGIFCMEQLTPWEQDGGMERGAVVMPFEETAVFQLLDPSVKRTLRQKAQQIKKYAKEEERSLRQRKTMQATGTADVLGVTYMGGHEQPWRAYSSC